MKDLLDSVKVRLSVAVAIVVAGIGGYLWMHSEFVAASDYRQDQKTAVVRELSRDKRQLETKVLELTVKRDVLPREQFNAVDKAMLKKYEKDLESVEKELWEVRIKEVK